MVFAIDMRFWQIKCGGEIKSRIYRNYRQDLENMGNLKRDIMNDAEMVKATGAAPSFQRHPRPMHGVKCELGIV